MKNLHTLPIVAAACCMMHAAAADTITLNLNIPTAPAEIQLNTSGYWTETYNTEEQYQHLEFGLYSFTHNIGGNGGEDLMSGMMSWNGFTYSTNSDTTNYALEGSSAAWIDNQWGCMAGGGILTDTLGRIMMRPDGCPQTDSGVPYLIGYWSFKSDADDNRRSLQIDFTDQQLHRLVGTWICNHPWPYYGNRYGDGFASKMENNGEHFRLVAHGLNSRLEDTGTSVTFDLASFHDDSLHQSRDWNWMDLSSLGSVRGIYFTMEGSDQDLLYGLNTAAYFCLSHMQILSHEITSAPERPTGLQADAIGQDSIQLTWDAADKATKYLVYINDALLDSTTQTTYTFTHLQPCTTYTFSVIGVADDGSTSDPAAIHLRTIDTEAPSTPSNLQAVADLYAIRITWDASTDNVAVSRYTIYVDGMAYRRTADTTLNITGLNPATTYLIEVEASDASGNTSTKAAITASTLTNAALTNAHEDTISTPDAIYTVDGRQLRPGVIPTSGLYIIKEGNRSRKITFFNP